MTDALNDAERELAGYYQRAIEGHVFIGKTLEVLFKTLGAKVGSIGSKPRVLELGSHAGITGEMLLNRVPNIELSVYDDDPDLVALGRRRLESRGVQHHAVLAGLEPFDLIYSIARHHHLPHDYLVEVRRVLKPTGAYLVADELCPEYCDEQHAARIRNAELLRVAGGYLLTNAAESADFDASGKLPQPAVDLENHRRRALWRWYRFVVDHAVERGYFDVAAGELQSARDDMVTGSDAEHKFSPLIVERQFELAGFRLVAKQPIAPAAPPEQQSFFVYEFAPAR